MKETSSPHIIRRKVKIVTTDDKGNEAIKITTKAGSTIEKTSVFHEAKREKPSYSKEGLGVVTSRHSRNNMSGIVVTQNGKKVEPRQDLKENKEEKSPEIVEEIKPIAPSTDVLKERTEPRREIRSNTQNYDNRRNTRQDGDRPRNTYNNNYSRPAYGNRQNNTDGNQNQRREYNPNYQRRTDYNNNNQNRTGSDRPYVKRDGVSGGQNNNFRPGFNRNRTSQDGAGNTGYKVNKFIKDTAPTILQKETRDYEASTLIDKRKQNTESDKTPDTKREKKNVNEIREKNTRMDFSKMKGMQVSDDTLMDLYDRGESRKYSSVRRKKQKPMLNQTMIIPLTEVTLPDTMSVKHFAESIKKQASEVIKKLFGLGILATVNQEIDFDTAFLLAEEYGIAAKKQVVVTEEDVLFDDTEDNDENMVTRPPIVTIMGHVDHGKTSLLDKIRSTNVVSGEFGGITQHIGAYKVKINDREITFLDTPGHEAFSEMRARGASITDIVVIVVAANDSIKPQTIEAINHAKAASVPIIIAINKIDVEGANVEKVKQDLLEYDLVSEEWGGDTICVPISAKLGTNIEQLLEMILLVADMKELKANPNKQAKGTVIEAKLDKTRGPLTTLLVQRGTLNVGDTIVLGDIVGKVRGMKNDLGELVKKAGPSTPVEILGLGNVPQTGEIFYEVKDEKTAHKLIEKRKAVKRTELIKQGSIVTLDDLYSKIKTEELKNLEIIIRADVQGSVEALKDSLEKLSNEEVRVKVISKNTGSITESDITLAKLSNAIIIGFNVKADATVTKAADKEKVDLRLYTVIYDAINDVTCAMKGMLKPIYEINELGTAEVRQIFKITGAGIIAGSYIKSGKITRNAFARVMRNNEKIADTKIEQLKREKDDAKEVAEGYECGIKLKDFADLKEGDILECYEQIEKKRD